MYVCVCKGITDAQIREAVNQGACKLRELRRELGVSTQCGKCACEVKGILADAVADNRVSEGLFYSLA